MHDKKCDLLWQTRIITEVYFFVVCVADYIANPKAYGDVEYYSWTSEEEEDYDPKGKKETSSDEEEVPLPQPGDMQVEFKKSSLPNKAKIVFYVCFLNYSCNKKMSQK